MKKGIFAFATLAVVLVSCNKNDDPDNDLIGTWNLTETLMDPGDGSGTFQSVNSSKTIKFKSDGTLIVHGSLCQPGKESGTRTKGTYSMSDSTITPNDCSSDRKLDYKLSENVLVISYPCIEPCREKYTKD